MSVVFHHGDTSICTQGGCRQCVSATETTYHTEQYLGQHYFWQYNKNIREAESAYEARQKLENRSLGPQAER